MFDQSYIGIDCTDNGDWIVVLWTEGKSIFSGPFKNTPEGLNDLASLIAEHGNRPKICIIWFCWRS